MSYHDDLVFALHLAELADSITMSRFEAGNLHVDTKPDMTPVSDADLATEKALRAKLAELLPNDDILGEEFGGSVSDSGRQWIIDPIDGTKNYVRGVPIWATLICLIEDGKPRVGVVSAPALHRRWWAVEGAGAFRSVNGGETKECHVSAISAVADCSIAFSDLEKSEWDPQQRENFIALQDEAWRLRGFGDFYNYCLLAEGAVDVALEPVVSPWDLAAVAIIVTEAGGEFTSFDGQPGPFHGSALATNGKLHETVVQALNK
ncbi:MAG: histidinol-phosphatase [Corynebacterium sp.]|nr:histidinol-phosphatase [Corynebacterium sp.]